MISTKEFKKMNFGKVLTNVNLKKYNTYKVNSTAKIMVFPKTLCQLKNLLLYIKENNLKCKVIGNGSNLIFCDEFYDGILIKLDQFNKMEIKGNKIYVDAGYSLIKLSMIAAKNNLTGLEFASGIPGTIGGAIFMNAGAYKSDMGYITKSVKALTPDLKIITFTNKDLDFHYRSSFFKQNPDYICLSAEIVLKKGSKDLILEIIKDRKRRRIETQPLEYPNAGSVFRNPKDDFAGRLIEELGYKSKRIGGAEVSQKHANFIINKDNASGKDIKKLIIEIKEKVMEKYNIDLQIEQEFVE